MGYGPSLELKIEDFLSELGYDTRTDHMSKTARRWIHALEEFKRRPAEELTDLFTTFQNVHPQYKGLVVVGGVQFASLCPHHLFPFQGTADVGYLPTDKIVGISKLARLVEFWTHQITTQEEATQNIADTLTSVLGVRGCMVVLRGNHTCMCARGARALGSYTTTSVVKGVFLDNEHGCRDEFLRLTARIS